MCVSGSKAQVLIAPHAHYKPLPTLFTQGFWTYTRNLQLYISAYDRISSIARGHVVPKFFPKWQANPC